MSSTTPSPYPGLRPFQETEQTDFYGREADTAALVDKILHHRLTLLFAATGVGKSSLLQAAVLPRLRAADAGREVIYHNDWVAPPLTALQHAIQQALQGQALIIVLDQFEEFFRYRHIHHRNSFQPFIDQLTDLILAPDLRVSLVFSMREDFALELNAFKPHLPNPLFGNYYRLEKLSEAGARAAITAPLAAHGYCYEPALLEQLLHDLLSRDLSRDAASLVKGVSADSVEPPYLQIVCSQLWELDQDAPNKTLRLATYQKAGGAKGLLENYVNYVLKRFADREKQVASKAFDHLISRRGTKMAYTADDLATLVNLKPVELGNVLDKLESARILRRQQRDQTVWYELYHDMFSGGIESWNTGWKNHMRLRRTVLATGASLLALAGIYFSVVAYLQASSKHLRLGTGNNDRVEVYTGTSKFPDPFGQQRYAAEADLTRNQLELDKRYPKRDVQDYALLGKELVGSQPADARFTAYINNGEYCQVSTLLGQLMPDSKPAPGCASSKETLVREARAAAKKPATTGQVPTEVADEDVDPLRDAALSSLTALKTPWGLELLQQAPQTIGAQHSYSGQSSALLNPLNTPIAFDEAAWIAQMKQNGFSGDPAVLNDPRQLVALLHWFMEDPAEANQMSQPGGGNQGVGGFIRDYAIQMTTPEMLRAILTQLGVTPTLYARLDSKDATQQEAAMLLLAQLGDSRAFDGIEKRLANNTAQSAPYFLAQLVGLDDARLTRLLLTVLPDRTHPQEMRAFAADTLGAIGAAAAVPMLLERLNDTAEWETIRKTAAQALGKIGDTGSSPILLALVANPQERSEVRLGALEALGMLGDTKAIPTLLERLTDPQERPELRTGLAMTLGALGDVTAVPPLLAAFDASSQTDDDLRSSLMLALGMLGDNRAVPALLAYRESQPVSFRFQLDEMLSRFDDSQARQALLQGNTGNLGLKGIKGKLEPSLASTVVFAPKGILTPPTVRWSELSETVYTSSLPTLPLSGSHAQKVALLAALNTPDLTARNPLLMRLVLDDTLSISLRVRALAGLLVTEEDTQQLAATIQQLQPLGKHTNATLRREAVQALAQLQSGAALLPYTQDPNLRPEMQETTLTRFAETAPRQAAITALLAVAKDEANPLHPTAFQLLGKLQATEALPVLEASLQTLEQEYRDWRNTRDQRPADEADSETFAQWQQAVKQATPKHAYLAAHYGYALAQIDRAKGMQVLAHDLADVREGAGLGFALTATPDTLQALDAARDQRKAAEPLFQQAAFHAIDKALTRLETAADDKALVALESWQAALQSRPDTDAVRQRLGWTISMIKHYQALDQEFKGKYGVERVKEAVVGR